MRFFLTFFVILATAAFCSSCKHTQYTVDKLPPKQLRWGNGGGFVGKETTHILCDNGQLFIREGKGTISEIKKTKGKKAKTLFKTAQTLGLAKLEFNHPGNIYNFLEFQDGDMVSRVVWGDKGYPVTKPIETLYAELTSLLKK